MSGTSKTPLLIPALAPVYAFGAQWGWTIVRIMLGLWLMPHGFRKVFQDDAIAASRNFVMFGWAYPVIWATAMGFLEFFGGFLLAIGLGTRVVATAFAIEFAVISFAVLYPNWQWGHRGMEYALMICILATMTAFQGGGRFSVDRLLGREL